MQILLLECQAVLEVMQGRVRETFKSLLDESAAGPLYCWLLREIEEWGHTSRNKCEVVLPEVEEEHEMLHVLELGRPCTPASVEMTANEQIAVKYDCHWLHVTRSSMAVAVPINGALGVPALQSSEVFFSVCCVPT